MERPDRKANGDELSQIYHQLKQGQAHERVTDANVSALISMARRYGDTLIEKMLSEWKAPQSDGSNGVPVTIAPTRGFNRDHTKH